MFANNKYIFLGAAGVVALWMILYFVMVGPTWAERDQTRIEAEGQLERWQKFYKKGKNTPTVKLGEALEKLEEEHKLLQISLDELRQIELAEDLGPYTITAAGSGDQNNYFDKKRRETSKEATTLLNIEMAPGLEDLGFRGKLNKDPVPLNLARLFMLRRFLQACKRAGVKKIMKIQYLKVVPKDFKSPEGERIDRIFEVPMTIRFRSQEPDFAQLLGELQLPSDKTRSYFCLRGFSASVKEDAQGEIDGEVAVGGLFSEKQFVETLKIPVEEEKGGTSVGPGPTRPVLDPSRY